MILLATAAANQRTVPPERADSLRAEAPTDKELSVLKAVAVLAPRAGNPPPRLMLVCRHAGVARYRVNDLLSRLTSKGLVRKVAPGHYRPTDAAVDFLPGGGKV